MNPGWPPSMHEAFMEAYLGRMANLRAQCALEFSRYDECDSAAKCKKRLCSVLRCVLDKFDLTRKEGEKLEKLKVDCSKSLETHDVRQRSKSVADALWNHPPLDLPNHEGDFIAAYNYGKDGSDMDITATRVIPKKDMELYLANSQVHSGLFSVTPNMYGEEALRLGYLHCPEEVDTFLTCLRKNYELVGYCEPEGVKLLSCAGRVLNEVYALPLVPIRAPDDATMKLSQVIGGKAMQTAMWRPLTQYLGRPSLLAGEANTFE
eukprot:TRINITY_DN1453_c0_g1_i1.p1 TRINITY_DN1453_c0_g1~~TRINITY_DN1453_c0_g1_i1.p1  ORF type:complete len:263 (-),score=25.65 TRINITY_DN1453_c0_g1_i1:55-843(-)